MAGERTTPERLVLLAVVGLVLTPVYLLSMCRRVFWGPRIPHLPGPGGDANPRELVIALGLLAPTWAIGLYEPTTRAVANTAVAVLSG